jgi:hypothetical protein
VDDGVPPNTVQRLMWHQRSSTTLDLYTRRTDNSDRILQALDDPEDDDPDDDVGSCPGAAVEPMLRECSGHSPTNAERRGPKLSQEPLPRPLACRRYRDRIIDLFVWTMPTTRRLLKICFRRSA